MNRTTNVVRMQLVNRQTYVWVPLIVLGGAFIVSIAIYAMLRSVGLDTTIVGGGAQAPLWYFAVVGAQALTLTFPFSQAMSVTRREFYLGTLLTAALTSAGLALVFVLGGFVEAATNGWGLDGYIFRLPWAWAQGPFGAGVFFFALAMMFFVVGFWGATIYKRWGTAVLTTVILAASLALLAGLWAVIRADAWMQLFGWFDSQGAIGVGLWQLLIVAVLGVMSYLTLRRATP